MKNNIKSLLVFLKEVGEELKKIHWPERKEFIFSVIATIIVVFLFAIFFGLVDSAIGYTVKSIILHFT
jgi:preprotein translocase subunit SecE